MKNVSFEILVCDMKFRKKKYKQSNIEDQIIVPKPLARKFTLIFLMLIVVTNVIFLLLNGAFLKGYYERHRITNIKEAYHKLNEASIAGEISKNSFTDELRRLCNTYNIDVVIIDEDSEMVLSSMNGPNPMIRQLLDNVFMEQNNSNKIYEENAVYTIERYDDEATRLQYMSMWGVLDNGHLFMIRSALESIRDSARLTNQFMMHIGVGMILLGGVFVWIVAYKQTEPILELARISKKMAQLDFDTKYTGEDKDEIGVLGKNINEMSDTLERTISELKTANIKLQQDIEKKEQIDEMRKEFLANVSHELKTPIALVLGYAEGLQDCLHDDAESREYYCEVIMDEAKKMDNMVKKLMMLNQLEFGNDGAVMERFDIVALIRNYVQSLDILLKQQEIVATISSDKESMFVWADEFGIEEVVRNYCSNAMNHVDEHKKINIDISTKNDKVRVSVFNTGKQIPREALPQIWDKFYKVDKARTREYGGSGVGLSIVKAVMETLNEQYGVANKEDGVEFWFELST